jgi:hypothetical protein
VDGEIKRIISYFMYTCKSNACSAKGISEAYSRKRIERKSALVGSVEGILNM